MRWCDEEEGEEEEWMDWDDPSAIMFASRLFSPSSFALLPGRLEDVGEEEEDDGEEARGDSDSFLLAGFLPDMICKCDTGVDRMDTRKIFNDTGVDRIDTRESESQG